MVITIEQHRFISVLVVLMKLNCHGGIGKLNWKLFFTIKLMSCQVHIMCWCYIQMDKAIMWKDKIVLFAWLYCFVCLAILTWWENLKLKRKRYFPILNMSRVNAVQEYTLFLEYIRYLQWVLWKEKHTMGCPSLEWKVALAGLHCALYLELPQQGLLM